MFSCSSFSGNEYNRVPGCTAVEHRRIFLKVPYDLFKFTTAEENGKGSHDEFVL